MKKFFYLSTCDTCKKIIKSLQLPEQIELIDIKIRPISEDEIEQMKDLSGSFESLFSKKAIKYRSLGLNNQNLMELDFKQLILEEYTFLKRPVLVIDDHIVIGNSKEAIDNMLKLSEQIK
jgi:arsenate reductase